MGHCLKCIVLLQLVVVSKVSKSLLTVLSSFCFLLNVNCFISDTSYTMSVKLGEVLSPDTNLYVQLFGEEGETSKIMLRPVGSSLNKFEKGRTYKFTVETVNIGKVSTEIRLYRMLVYAMQCFL